MRLEMHTWVEASSLHASYTNMYIPVEHRVIGVISGAEPC